MRGILSGLSHVDNNTWSLSKPLYNQAESLIALLAIIENTGNKEAIKLFSEVYTLTIKNYVQKDRGFTLWQDRGDRWVTFREHGTRAENFHHPRHLLLNLQVLNRMIKHSEE